MTKEHYINTIRPNATQIVGEWCIYNGVDPFEIGSYVNHFISCMDNHLELTFLYNKENKLIKVW